MKRGRSNGKRIRFGGNIERPTDTFEMTDKTQVTTGKKSDQGSLMLLLSNFLCSTIQ